MRIVVLNVNVLAAVALCLCACVRVPVQLYIIAQQSGLWEECLGIIHFSERRDQDTVIRALWKNVIREQIQICESSKTDWSLAVRDKVIALAKKYADVPFMFPLEFICKELEEYNTKLRWRAEPSRDFVMNTLIDAKLPPMQLLDVYNRMIESLVRNPLRRSACTRGRGSVLVGC
jgi:hypothetical protein